MIIGEIEVAKSVYMRRKIAISDVTHSIYVTHAEARAVAAELIRLADEIDAKNKAPAP